MDQGKITGVPVPDFEQIALDITNDIGGATRDGAGYDHRALAARLRDIWNARGEADKRAATVAMMYLMGTASAPFYCEKIDREIDELNR